MFTPGCQFKCPFCHNAALVTPSADIPYMEPEAFWHFLAGRVGILDGVCITGGEPTLQPDLEDFATRIKALGLAVKLDTNGYKPEVLKRLAEKGLLDYVAMDIKNAPEHYAETTGLPSLCIDTIKESMEFLKSGAVDFEFRTTVVQEFHNKKNMLSLAQWLSGEEKYFLQEFKDSGGLIASGLHGVPVPQMEEFLSIMRPYLPQIALRKS